MNETKKFNLFWKFLKQPIETTLNHILKKEKEFIDVALPHDWLIYNVKNLYETSSGWYLKDFELEIENDFSYFLKFEGVYMDSTVYINDQSVGAWKYGYTSFEFEITKYLKKGKNRVVVQVKHEHPNSRWYSGAGIYRDVWFIKKNKKRILNDGVYVKTNHFDGSVVIHTELTHDSGFLEQKLYYKDKLIAHQKDSVNNKLIKQKLVVEKPILWSPDDPNLYSLETNLYINDNLYDTHKQNVGFRDIVMDSEKGLFINGKKSKLNGVCEHHDFGSLGSVFSKVLQRRRFEQLKEMGVNAIRTAHYVPAPDFMELADEMGFLIVSDAFDMWERQKTQFDYSRFFKEHKAIDVKSWIKRDRNHVSLLMWSIGNEIYDTHVDESGLRITEELKQLVLQYDYLENAPITIGSNFMMGENAQRCTDLLKYAGYNYAEKLYNEQHLKYPDWKIYGSETGSIVQSRGIYHFPLESLILVDDDKQCSSLGNSTTSWGAKSLEYMLSYDQSLDYSLGQFIWTGFDYIGEPTPYDTKNSYFGQIDTAGFPKDSFYVYKALWTKEPVLHIFPYWDFNDNQLIDVRVASNLQVTKLFLNDRFIGEKLTKDELIPTWKIPYEKGELLVIGYDEFGNEILRDSRRSFGDGNKLKVSLSKDILKADGIDLLEIIIELEDLDGNHVYNANNEVTIKIDGPAKLLGMDNGDSTDYDEYKTNTRKLFSGKLKVLIGSLYQSGKVNLVIDSPNMESVSKTIEITEVNLIGEYKIAQESNYRIRSGESIEKSEDNKFDFISIRKIELKSKTNILSKEKNETEIEYKIYPENATNKELVWKVVNAKGVETSIAKIRQESNRVYVKGLGDGNFTLRCMDKNDKNQATIISELQFDIKGIGIAYKNPYKFISASLYDDFEGEIKSGNEKGIATSNEVKSILFFNNIDFGLNGSEYIELPIFSFDSKPLEIKLYVVEGNNKQKELIDTFTYYKDTIWDVYQSERYKLSKRLKGNKDIALEFSRSVHFKGFVFDEYDKTYEEVSVLENDMYYGDYFEKENWGFSNIGNNVSFSFNNLNFNEGISSIKICGRSKKDNNTIRLQITNVDGNELVKNIEFMKSQSFNIIDIKLDDIRGKSNVEFIFLPGSSFDFKWFKFIKNSDELKGETK
ncbi:glycoside hydrolase family 2 TIM barrel-domain containing protein [Haploplasma axanthum]|nr:glycoside hydrolase family 2 TIM barrel-domain containing protein [Haploplasma axanthum]